MGSKFLPDGVVGGVGDDEERADTEQFKSVSIPTGAWPWLGENHVQSGGGGGGQRVK
jgi:hypothetical protein